MDLAELNKALDFFGGYIRDSFSAGLIVGVVLGAYVMWKSMQLAGDMMKNQISKFNDTMRDMEQSQKEQTNVKNDRIDELHTQKLLPFKNEKQREDSQ